MTACPASMPSSLSTDERPQLRVRFGESSAAPRLDRAPLRIGVNLLPLELRIGGMRHYVLQLIPAMIRRSKHQFVIFHLAKGIPCLKKMLRTLTVEERRRVTTIELHYLDQVIAYGGLFDFYFCPLNGFAPQMLDRPTMATIADVQEQFFPQYFTAEQLEARAEVYPNTARAVTTLLTLSEFSRQSICRSFDVPEDKVKPIHLAPNQGLLDAEPVWPTHRAPLPERYLFYPASLYPHKNHELLLRSFQRLLEREPDVSLVLTGHPASPGVDIEQRIADLGLQERVLWLGHVSSGELRHLYMHTLALVFPSSFEGFGIPLVEAMLFDCPVVAVPSTCVGEVVDDAALLVPAEEGPLCDAMARIVADGDLRRRLVQRGREVVQRFTVERLADTTLDFIDETHERFWNPERPADAAISYAILPGSSDTAVEHTLLSLLDELGDQDEILIPGELDRLGLRLQELCRNCEAVRLIADATPQSLAEAARHAIVSVLPAGTVLCRGAAATVAAAFAERSPATAVVGDVLSRDHAGNYNGIVQLTSRETCGRDTSMPIEAVFWRREALVRLAGRTESFDKLRRPRLAAGTAVPLYRTVVCTTSESWASVTLEPQPLALRIARTLRRGPVPAARAGVRVARRVASRVKAKLL